MYNSEGMIDTMGTIQDDRDNMLHALAALQWKNDQYNMPCLTVKGWLIIFCHS